MWVTSIYRNTFVIVYETFRSGSKWTYETWIGILGHALILDDFFRMNLGVL